MATADQYADWIVKNADKKGTPEFDTVAKAYQEAKAEESAAPAATPAASSEGVPAARKPQLSDLPGNILPSVSRVFVEPLLHPIDTTKALLNAAAGGAGVPEATAAVTKNLPLPRGEVGAQVKARREKEQAQLAQASAAANAVPEHFKRYTTLEGIKNALITDPAGVAADVSMLFGGGAGLSRAAGLPGTAAVLEKGATITNPLTLPAMATGKALGWAAPTVVKTARAVDTALQGKLPQARAALMAREAAGPDLAAIRAAMDADPNLTAAEAAAMIERPQFQALAETSTSADKSNFYYKRGKVQEQNRQTTLDNLAGGATNTEILNNLSKSKTSLNQLTTPMRETELAAANTGKYKQRLEREATTLGDIASGKVDDVRRFTAARQRLNAAKTQADLSPNVSQARLKFTGEMEDAAERVATQAAEESRLYGEGARFAQNRADSLAAHGLKPLDTEGLIRDISGKLNSPKLGVSDVNRKVLTAVSNKIKEWTARNGGVIDANALYEIRKNTVNEVIEGLGGDPKASAKRAASLLAETKPLIDDAIIKAGGTGWKNYLDTFAAGMDVINQRKLAQTARDLYKKSPDEFVALVRGERPDLVEEIFGKGRNDIKVEMGAKYKALDNVAHELERSAGMKTAAEAGAEHLGQIAKQAQPSLRVPFFGLKATVGNAVLKELSGKLNTKTMDILEKGFRSGADMKELLDSVPFGDRSKVYNAIAKVNRFNVSNTAAGLNALAGQNQNQLRND